MRKALMLIVVATLLVGCTACSNANDGADGKPKSQCRDMGNSVTVCEFPRPNGGTVECVKTYGLGGGMSCDWDD